MSESLLRPLPAFFPPGDSMHARHMRRLSSVFATLCLIVAAGCAEEPEIRSYERPRDADAPGVAATQPKAPAESSGPARMIAAVILREGQAWFIKAFGPEDEVDAAAAQVREFIQSVKLPAEEPAGIAWETPAGWAEGGERMMREATLIVPDTDPPLEVAISKLGYDGQQDQYLKMNVNRWRGQLGLEPADKMDESASVEQIDVDGGRAWVFDATGEMAAGGGMTPPMMRGKAPSAGGGAAPAEAPPTAGNDDSPTDKPSIVFEAPDDWTEGERGMMGSRSYQVGESDERATVKVSDFAAFGMMADPLMNVNRWRAQLGAPPLDKESLAESTEKIEIAGAEGTLCEIVAPDDSQAMLAAMVLKFDQVWFFQLLGKPDAVETHRDEFVDWLGSVKIEQAKIEQAKIEGDSSGEEAE